MLYGNCVTTIVPVAQQLHDSGSRVWLMWAELLALYAQRIPYVGISFNDHHVALLNDRVGKPTINGKMDISVPFVDRIGFILVFVVSSRPAR